MTLLKNNARATAIGSVLVAACTVSSSWAADLSAVPSGSYEVDPTHAYIHFEYNHLGLSNPKLSFDDFSIDLNLDSSDPTKSIIMVTIDPASIVTGSEIWKDHLTSADWFDVASHPEITFQSSSIEAAGDGAYKVDGSLTIKGESKPASLNVTINAAMNHPMSGKPVIGMDASSTVLRSDYGMGKFVPNISDEVTVSITAELAKSE